jgi:hypothetical protein
MATTTNITTSYAGEGAMPYVAAALFSSPTLEQGGVDIIPNIKFRKTLRPASVGDIIADATCDFTATSSVTLLERILEPKELQVNQKFCKADFIDTWDAIEMGFSAFDVIPKTFADFIIAEYVAKVAEANETNIWRGVASNTGEYNGFTTIVAADADLPAAQEITGETVTAANVVDELGKVVDAIPNRLYGKEDLRIYVATNVYKAYTRALGGFGPNGQGAAGVNNQGNNQSLGALEFDGVQLFMTYGLAANTMLATRVSNLKFGTGLLSDHSEVRIIDTSETLGDKNVRFVMRFTAAVQYTFAKDIVTYGIVNSANPA